MGTSGAPYLAQVLPAPATVPRQQAVTLLISASRAAAAGRVQMVQTAPTVQQDVLPTEVVLLLAQALPAMPVRSV